MPGAATKAMPMSIRRRRGVCRTVERQRERRRPRAAATACGGRAFARSAPSLLITGGLSIRTIPRFAVKCKSPEATPASIFQQPASAAAGAEAPAGPGAWSATVSAWEWAAGWERRSPGDAAGAGAQWAPASPPLPAAEEAPAAARTRPPAGLAPQQPASRSGSAWPESGS